MMIEKGSQVKAKPVTVKIHAEIHTSFTKKMHMHKDHNKYTIKHKGIHMESSTITRIIEWFTKSFQQTSSIYPCDRQHIPV